MSLTVGQTWVIVMEVLELILLSGDLRFLSHHGLLCPDFLPAWEEKIRELFFFLSSSYLHLCQKYNSVNICVIICESMWNCKYTFIPCLFNAQQWLLFFSFFFKCQSFTDRVIQATDFQPGKKYQRRCFFCSTILIEKMSEPEQIWPEKLIKNN